MELLLISLLVITSLTTTNVAKTSPSPSLTYSVAEESPRGTIVAKLFDDAEQIVRSLNIKGLSSSAPLNLMVTNWQDVGPKHFAIESTSGYLVVNVKPNRESLCPDLNSGTRFSLNQPSSNSVSFSSNSIDRKIHGPDAADRPCNLVLKVVCTTQDSEATQFDPILITVNVIVKDINDNAPTFPQLRMNVELSETSSIVGETTIPLPAANDPDVGINGTLSYWLEGQQRMPSNFSFPFSLEGLVDGQPLMLRLIHPLDYEKVKMYEFSLCVEDHGRPNSLTGKLKIHVDVIDENDNVPIIEKSDYFIIINETFPRGSILLDIHANDNDSNRNGQVSFELPIPMTEEAKTVQHYFDVRTVSPGYAKLYLRQSPDLDFDLYQQKQPQILNQLHQHKQDGVFVRRSRDFVLRLVASDNGVPRRQTAEAVVTIRVLDVNDMAPKISLSYINAGVKPGGVFGGAQRSQDGRLPENTDHSFLAFVSVQDLDSGPWGQVSCWSDNDAFNLLPMNGETSLTSSSSPTSLFGTVVTEMTTPQLANEEVTFKLMAQKPFDREKVPQVTFRIICVDNVYKSSQSQTFIEDSRPPHSVHQSKTGYDSHNDPENLYTLVGDRGKQLTGIASVTVRILDENDSAPEFKQPDYAFSVEENVPNFVKETARGAISAEGKAIGVLQALDIDLNSQLVYQLDSNPLDAFSLDAKSGVLSIVRPFDREAFLSASYDGIEIKPSTNIVGGRNESSVIVHMTASVSDGKHTAKTRIQVTILDVNDCLPVFERPNYEFYIQENQRPTNLGSVVAHDADDGFNGKIVYRLEPISSSNTSKAMRNYSPIRFFKVEPSSGEIQTLRPLDREQQTHHVFHVLAIDTSGSPFYYNNQFGRQQQQHQTNQFTATASVTIIVQDENDNAPIISFPTSHSTLTVEAGTPAGQQIFVVTASDPDLGENGTIRYTLRQSLLTQHEPGKDSDSQITLDGEQNTTPLFSIQEQAGIVFLSDKLSKAPARHLLIIGAHDIGSGVQRNTSVTAIINVVQKNNLDSVKLKSIDPKGGHLGHLDSSASFPDEFVPGQGKRYGSGYPQPPIAPQLFTEDAEKLENDRTQLSSTLSILTDRVIIFVLSSIFIVLLIVTVVLILLIRRRRFMNVNGARGHKSSAKSSQIQNNIDNPILPCDANPLQLVHTEDGSPPGKAMLYRAGITSDSTSQGDSEVRSMLTTDTYPNPPPMHAHQGGGFVDGQSYSLLHTRAGIPYNEMGVTGYKAYGPCVPLAPFPSVIQVSHGMTTQERSQSRGTLLYSPTTMSSFSPQYAGQAIGYAQIYPSNTAKVTSKTSNDANGGDGEMRGRKGSHRSGDRHAYHELPSLIQTVEDDNGCEYQMLLGQQKMPLLIQRTDNARQLRLMQSPQDDRSTSNNDDIWPTSTEEVEFQDFVQKKSSSMSKKSVTLQSLHRSNSTNWHLEPETTLPSAKIVKFSPSYISLNNLVKNPESSYI